MSTITKEWLQSQISAIKAVGITDSNTLQAFEIALASLEAEASGRNPVLAYADSYRDMANQGVESIPVWSVITDLERNIAPLFTAPPVPVSVPDAMEMDDDFDSSFEHGKAVGWNACRATILQRAEPVQGWIPCSDRMPTKNHRVLIFINFNSDTVPPSIHDAQFTGSTFRRGNATVNVFPLEDGYGVTHWMPLPAAPQQGA
ncbi:DUF551 domain-containing protein [Enterobacter hormaechei]|uniref:DUF551 domain-containing protein n=1 Tax=Enterobacter hormaechei TaxID=158836 RepID=UPI0039C7428B